MRLSSVLLTSAAFALGVASLVAGDNGDGSNGFCLLKSLDFTGGLFLVGAFAQTKFDYQCSCADFGKGPFKVVPRTLDVLSTAEVTFNGAGLNTKAKGNAISNGGTVAQATETQSADLNFKVGTNVIVVGVSCNGNSSPPCYYEYTITCTMPDPGSSVIGDPQFVGLRGQEYQIHGVSGEIYNIVSDADLQYNSRFVFLSEGKCPVVNGRKQKGCFSHPGSYLGELGLKTRAGDKIRVLSGSAKQGFAAVEVNGRVLDIDETVMLAGDLGSISLNNTHVASMQIGNWDFVFSNSDMYLNQQVRVMDKRKLRSHGLLGQTWRETIYPNAIKHIQGQVDDYVIREADIFGDSFVYNSFN